MSLNLPLVTINLAFMKLEKLSIKLLAIVFISVVFNCSKNEDNSPIVEEPQPITLDNEINDFIWSGLNEIYLWNDNVPNLADNKFATQDDYYTFLNGYSTPEALFDGLLYQKDVVDRFSLMVSDYIEWENTLQANTNSNGLDFGLLRLSGSDDVFGYVRYVANDSDAATKDIDRGDFFLTVDGMQLTVNNYSDLLFGANNTYTLGMANITGNTIAPNGKTVELTKNNFTENPILIQKVIDENGKKVGYLMFNHFLGDFENALNDAFVQFKTDGITELVLDIRYNGGGFGSRAVKMASMITGQFEGQIFYKQQWNSKYQAYFQANAPEQLVNPFVNTLSDGTSITSLNLNKIYILTADGTASASELIINGLDPYIDVIKIGTTTYGKYVGSITLYDSVDYSKDNVNPNHTYAMQPIVIKSVNSVGVSDYYNGFTPDYTITYQTSSGAVYEGENILDMGVLGDVNESFLAKALSLIAGSSRSSVTKNSNVIGIDFNKFADSKDFTPYGKNMYFEFKSIK
jgi:C-terminal processing protease CtpA/Prc